jgi:hypothetical protein
LSFERSEGGISMAATQIANSDPNSTYRTLLNELATELFEINSVNKKMPVKKTVSSVVTGNLFTITSLVKIKAIYGVITTAIEAKANAGKLIFTPTGGTYSDLCATVELNNAAIRKILYVPTLGSAMVIGSDSVGVCITVPPILKDGIISFNGAGGTSTGVIDWYIEYEPQTLTGAITAI